MTQLLDRKHTLAEIISFEPWNDGAIQEYVEILDKIKKEGGAINEEDYQLLKHIYW